MFLDIELGSKFGDADIIFNATHPFLIFVEESKTGSIVFAGKVQNPLQTESLSFPPLPSRFGESGNGSPQPATPAPGRQLSDLKVIFTGRGFILYRETSS